MAERLVFTLEVWVAAIAGEPAPEPGRAGDLLARFDRAARDFERIAKRDPRPRRVGRRVRRRAVRAARVVHLRRRALARAQLRRGPPRGARLRPERARRRRALVGRPDRVGVAPPLGEAARAARRRARGPGGRPGRRASARPPPRRRGRTAPPRRPPARPPAWRSARRARPRRRPRCSGARCGAGRRPSAAAPTGGRGRARPSSVPEPPWKTTAAQPGSSSHWSTWRSIRTCGGLRAQRRGIDVAPHGGDHRPAELAQAGERARQQVAGLEPEHRPDRQVHGAAGIALGDGVQRSAGRRRPARAARRGNGVSARSRRRGPIAASGSSTSSPRRNVSVAVISSTAHGRSEARRRRSRRRSRTPRAGSRPPASAPPPPAPRPRARAPPSRRTPRAARAPRARRSGATSGPGFVPSAPPGREGREAAPLHLAGHRRGPGEGDLVARRDGRGARDRDERLEVPSAPGERAQQAHRGRSLALKEPRRAAEDPD